MQALSAYAVALAIDLVVSSIVAVSIICSHAEFLNGVSGRWSVPAGFDDEL